MEPVQSVEYRFIGRTTLGADWLRRVRYRSKTNNHLERNRAGDIRSGCVGNSALAN